MTKTFNNATVTLTTSESDVYVAPSKAMTMIIQAVNPTSVAVNCELWMTDSSNTHKACLFPSQAIAAYDGLSDNMKHVFPSGYKIRGTAGSDNAIYVEVSLLEGL